MSTENTHRTRGLPVRQLMVLATAALSASITHYPCRKVVTEPRPNVEHREQDLSAGLDFFLGTWRLTTWSLVPNGTRVAGAGGLTGRRMWDNRGLAIDEWYPVDAGAPDFKTTRILVYNPNVGKVIGASINTLGNAKHWEVAIRQDSVIVAQTGGMRFEGRPGISRIVYHRLNASSFEARSELSLDDGETWIAEFGYTANRSP